MSEFDARDTPESGSWAPIPLRPRPSYAKYLGVAAAVVAVVGLGVVVSQAGRGGGDDDAADTAAIESAAEPVDGDADTAFIESAPARSSEPASEFNDEVSGEIANDQGEEAPEENSADGQADEPTVDTVRSAVPPDFDADAPIADDGELGIYGAYLLNQRDSGELGATPEYNCPAQSYPFLDEAIFMFDGDERPVYVAVDEAGGFVFAIDVDTCDALAVGSLTDP
jgi:hypothetical protein